MLKTTGLFVAFLLLCAGSSAFACYSGLGLIPTADTVGAGQYCLDLQADGSFKSYSTDTKVVNFQMGYGERFEVGMDVTNADNEKSEKELNAKYVFALNKKRSAAYAFGVCCLARHSKPSTYFAASRDLGSFRFHYGGIHYEEGSSWFVGVDREIAKNWTLMADYTSGGENYSSVGLNYQLKDNVGLFASAMLPNNSGDSLFSMHVVLNGPYK